MASPKRGVARRADFSLNSCSKAPLGRRLPTGGTSTSGRMVSSKCRPRAQDAKYLIRAGGTNLAEWTTAEAA